MSNVRLYATAARHSAVGAVALPAAAYVFAQGMLFNLVSHNAEHKVGHSIQNTEGLLKFTFGGKEISRSCLTPAVQNAKTTAEVAVARNDYFTCVDADIPSNASLLALPLMAILLKTGFTSARRGWAYFHAAKNFSSQIERFALIDPAEAAEAVEPDTSKPVADFSIMNGIFAHTVIVVPPHTTIYSERGSLLSQSEHITMTSTASAKGKRGFKDFFSRTMSGEGAFLMRYENTSDEAQELILKPSGSQQLAEIDLTKEGTIVCQNGAFFASNAWVTIGLKHIGNASFSHFSGEGLTMQKIEIADEAAKILISSHGDIIKRELKKGETLHLQKRALLAAGRGITMGLQEVKGTFTRLAGGEGAFLTTVTGPGNVWITTQEHKEASSNYLSSMIRRIIPG